MTAYMIQLSPRRYLVVWERCSGITGGSVGSIEFKWMDIAYGPATYDKCIEWLRSQS